MWWMELAAAFTIALIFVSILVGLLSWSLPGRASGLGTLIILFLVFFLSVWGLGTWIEPVGPEIWGTSLLPFVFVGFFLALLLAALAPPRRGQVGSTPASADSPTVSSDAGVAATGALMWVLIIGLIGAIVVGIVLSTDTDGAGMDDGTDLPAAGMLSPEDHEGGTVESGAEPPYATPSMDPDSITESAEDELLTPSAGGAGG